MNNPVKGNARSILFFALATFIVVVSSSKTARAQDREHGNAITAQLISFNQVPAVLAQSSGSFTAEINPDGTISFSLSYANMSSSVVQAHIHFGASKTNGGVMVFLCGGPKPECPASGAVTGTLTAADVSILPATNPDSVIPQGVQPGDFTGMLSAIRSGNSYVNVHTTNFPNGEIRGQVHVGRSDPALEK
jgi:CHRD domain